ncbi:MAG: rhomboid family intramembrane serine protease [Sphingobacteriales bacterium]|nr:MAG: rhomboid family intramembrane serine protease [Sphingobacteriales bacterium]
MKITYNSPVVLSFTLICTIIMSLDSFSFEGLTRGLFTVYPDMDIADPLTYFRLASHSIGHADWGHLVSNLTLILLLGPMLEEKYGSKMLMIMMLITTLITGILSAAVFSSGLLGASGIVFMFILLSSLTNFKSGHIPLTFLLVMILFLGNEVISSFQEDNIAQFAHIIGGVCGGIFGYRFGKSENYPQRVD